jgi:hypothetical protein
MRQHLWILLGSAAAGYFLASTLNHLPSVFGLPTSTAYNIGAKL